MRDWSTTVALITGASQGIGRATALAMNALGAHVWVCARDAQALHALTQHATHPDALHARACDITDVAGVASLLGELEEAHGRLDLLVNNASILGPTGELEGLDVAHWQETMRINVDGTFIVSQRAIAPLRKGHCPLMINLSSSVGRAPRAEWGAYCVSKFGVEAITGILAAELAEDAISVVSLNPGGTATQMRASAYPEEDPDTLPGAQQVAKTIVLLAGVLTPAQSGRRYSSRALFEVERAAPEALPHD